MYTAILPLACVNLWDGSSELFPPADGCTVGNITRVTISDDSFPFGYDETQFRHCLSADVAKENIASLAEKVDVDEFQKVILDKLNEVVISQSGVAQV